MWRIVQSKFRYHSLLVTKKDAFWTYLQATWDETLTETVNGLVLNVEERRSVCVTAPLG